MNPPTGLSLEQQFELRKFAAEVDGMSHEQAQEGLVKLYGYMMAREAMYLHFLKQEWGI